ncbi:hypothetical protein CS8_005380 [Cupriavidus sp. 8B]
MALKPDERATCLRCGGALYRDSSRAYRRLLPLVVTGLILFLISNAYPILAMASRARAWSPRYGAP